MKRLSALFILIISSCSLKADYDVKQLILEQACSTLSGIAHEASSAIFPRTIPDIFAYQKSFQPNNYYYKHPVTATAFKATAELFMAMAIESYKNRNNKLISKKELFKKALDRASPSMIAHLAQLIIPFENSIGYRLVEKKISESGSNTIRYIMIPFGMLAIWWLNTKVSTESAERYSKYRMKPQSLLFANEVLRRTGCSLVHNNGIKNTLKKKANIYLFYNKLNALSYISTWLPRRFKIFL